jgi:hypothetical protein
LNGDESCDAGCIQIYEIFTRYGNCKIVSEVTKLCNFAPQEKIYTSRGALTSKITSNLCELNSLKGQFILYGSLQTSA